MLKDEADVDPKMLGLWPMLGVTFLYLYVVLSAGPKFMAKRKPFSLRPVIILYNAAMVLICFSWLYKFFSTKGLLDYISRSYCHGTLEKEQLEDVVVDLNRYYFFTKILDLMDTIFLLLKKNERQITFLHVYHHSTMVMIIWYGIMAERASYGVSCMAVNTAVHVVMYFYYFLSSLGPAAKKYLFWKKHLTVLQMSSFMFMLSYVVLFYKQGCDAKFSSIVISVFLFVSNTILFLNFFRHAYTKNKTVKNN